MATTVGEIQYKVTIDTSSFKSQMTNVKKDVDNTSTGGVKAGGKLSKGWAVAAGAIAGVASAAFSKVTSIISSSVSSAVKRFDTMNNFPKVMSNLGISSEQAQKAVDKLGEKLTGLPTNLDEAALAVQRLTSVNNDIGKSTDYFLALNNAILAGGASSQLQSSAIEQLSQAYSKGKMDMMEWRTLQQAMPAQLNQIAKAMGITTDELGEGLRKGDISMEQFMQTINKLNTEGVEGFASFEKQARNATGGIETSMKVAQAAVTRGITSIISAIGGQEINSALTSLGGLFESVFSGKNIEKNTKNFATAISGMVQNIVKSLPQWLSNLSQVFVQLVQQIVPKLPQMIKDIVNALTAPDNLAMIIDAAIQLGLASLQAMPQITSALIDAIPVLIDNLVDFLTSPENLLMIAMGMFKLLWEMVKVPFKILPSLLKAMGKLLLSPLQLVWGFVRKFADAMGGNVKAMVDKVGEFIGAMKQAAKNLMKGMWQGIINAKDAVVNKIKEVCKGALDAVKGFFGIKSPSRVMAQMGNYLMEGFENGIANAGAGVVAEVQRVNSAVANAFGVDDFGINPTVGTSGSFSNNTIGGTAGSRSGFGSVVVNQNVVANTPVDMQIINQRLGNAVRRATA